MPRPRKAKSPTKAQAVRQGASANPKPFKGSKGLLRSLHSAMKSLKLAEEAVNLIAGNHGASTKPKKRGRPKKVDALEST